MAGIPTAHAVHHYAYTVPDLDQAVSFFVEVLGAQLATQFGPLEDPVGDSFSEKVGIHPRSVLKSALLRFGPTLNVALHEFRTPDQVRRTPAQSDIGGSHLGIYVEDLEAAAEYLRGQEGVVVRPLGPAGPPELDGLTNFFFETPWGQVLEVLSFSGPLAYENTTDVRLWGPGPVFQAS